MPELLNQIDNPANVPSHEICGIYREFFQGARAAGYGVIESSKLAVRETQNQVWERADNAYLAGFTR